MESGLRALEAMRGSKGRMSPYGARADAVLWPPVSLLNRQTCTTGPRLSLLPAFVNNLTDERALLALDRERGTRARVGYLTNQPRTFGVSLGYNY